MFVRAKVVLVGTIPDIVQAIAKNNTLRCLQMDLTPLDSASIAAIGDAVAANTSMQTLSLAAMWHTPDETAQMYQFFGQNPVQPCTVTPIARALETNRTLLHLDLCDNSLGNMEAVAFAKALEMNCTLQYLDVSRNVMGSEGIKALCEALLEHPSLLVLKLSVRDRESQQEVTKLLQRNKILQRLDLKVCDDFPDLHLGLETNTSLYSFHLSGTYTDETLASLAHALHTNVTLTEISISTKTQHPSNDILVKFGETLCDVPRYYRLTFSRGLQLSSVSHTLGLEEPAGAANDYFWLDDSLVEYLQERHFAKFLAFAMSQHARLGSESGARGLSKDCLLLITWAYFGLEMHRDVRRLPMYVGTLQDDTCLCCVCGYTVR